VDLLGAAPLQWEGAPFKGWFGLDHKLTIAGYSYQLVDPIWQSDGDVPPPLEFRPREEQRPEYGLLPQADLQLLNTSAQGRKWPINRVITLIGRDERCRITVVDERISRTHCALLLLPTGLWVIDLFGKGGIKVNGEDCCCSLLANGAELQLGPYRMTASYPQVVAMSQAAPVTLDTNTYGSEFVTQQNRILSVETLNDILFISPLGDTTPVLYQDVHVESSRIMQLLTGRKFSKVVIDLDKALTVGPHVLQALQQICRSPLTTQAVICGGSPEIRARHENSTLLRVWNHVPSRQAALQALAAGTK
jgi:hypothetical protein